MRLCLIFQPLHCFTYVTAYSTAISLLHLRHKHFTYITAHSPTLPPLYLHHSSFYNPSFALPTSQALRLRHSSFSNPSIASSTPQLILQPFHRFTYVTGHFTTLPLLHLRHRHFTYFTWRAVHAQGMNKQCVVDQLVTASTKFRSSHSFGQLLRILLRAVNLFSFSHIVCSDSSFNIHNALYFVKYPSRAAQNSPEGRRRPAGRGLQTPDLVAHFKVNACMKYSIVYSRTGEVAQ